MRGNYAPLIPPITHSLGPPSVVTLLPPSVHVPQASSREHQRKYWLTQGLIVPTLSSWRQHTDQLGRPHWTVQRIPSSVNHLQCGSATAACYVMGTNRVQVSNSELHLLKWHNEIQHEMNNDRQRKEKETSSRQRMFLMSLWLLMGNCRETRDRSEGLIASLWSHFCGGFIQFNATDWIASGGWVIIKWSGSHWQSINLLEYNNN